jgi:flagellar motor switch protein FliM
VEGIITPAEHPIEEDYPYHFGNGLYLRLKVMAFGYVKPGETKHMQLHYANATNKEMTVRFEVPDKLAGLKFNNPGKIGPKAKGVVNISFTMPHASRKGAVFTVYPQVNHKKVKEKLEIKILNELTISRSENKKRSLK